MPPESTDGDVSDLLEIIFRANLHRIRTPRFDSGVVHGDPISRGAWRLLGVRECQAARILIDGRSADRLVDCAAQDEVLAEVKAGI